MEENKRTRTEREKKYMPRIKPILKEVRRFFELKQRSVEFDLDISELYGPDYDSGKKTEAWDMLMREIGLFCYKRNITWRYERNPTNEKMVHFVCICFGFDCCDFRMFRPSTP